MAAQPSYPPYAQNKGTLVPGQVISVNKYNVQVERYLSQGGFAHVYLVRIATPVNNTTQHVLKRIAVASESLLSEVEKEIDFMRLLQGHPNIVRLIDASRNRLPTGVHEVFILMEYCAGGGIIDMMNRRLRERLTESEILQIFVDVCEGVAAMHNNRPAMLHRDLKVENILQSSPTLYKLCDFGSATYVAPRPPSSTQEVRAIEADLNRHTTLQYRAPEMVDPYQRRPIDEKSDVWALGVLLYKLCYYTTPFEEHGPLAILNVQYRTPHYPIYSSHMKSLIGSMLQEYGTQRPHVFQILTWVHNLRGTKSRFTYTIPTPTPLSPRSLNLPSFQPNNRSSLEGLVTYPSGTTAAQPKKSPGVQAREKVLEAIAPLRRGRSGSASHQSVPSQGKVAQGINWPDNSEFEREKEKAWTTTKQGVSSLKEQLAPGATDTTNSQKAKDVKVRLGENDAWSLRDDSVKFGKNDFMTPVSPPGLASNLSLQKPRDVGKSTPPALAANPGITLTPQTSVSKPSGSTRIVPPSIKVRDAFEGLGLSLPQKSAPLTLNEARKLRTGLAAFGGSNFSASVSGSSIPRSVASLPPSQRSPRSIVPDKSSPETRFPSLEELDASFTSSNGTGLSSSPGKSSSLQSHLRVPSDKPSSLLLSLPRGHHLTGGLRPHAQAVSAQNNGTRSQQVTGVAMRGSSKSGLGRLSLDSPVMDSVSASENDNKHRLTTSKPSLPRSQRSSVSSKPVAHTTVELLGQSFYQDPPGGLPDQTTNPQSVNQKKDLLTGSEDERSRPSTPSPGPPYRAILRGSPGKRAAVERPQGLTQSPKEAVSQQAGPEPPNSSLLSATTMQSSSTRRSGSSPPNHLLIDSELKVNDQENFAEMESPTAVHARNDFKDSSSSEDEGPEDVFGYAPSVRASKTDRNRRGRGRQSSVHELVDLWNGVTKDGDKETGRLHTTTPNDPVSPKKKDPTPTPKPLSALPRSSSPDKLASSQAVNKSPKRAHHHKGSRDSIPSPAGAARPQSMLVFPVHKPEEDPSPTSSSAFQSPSQPKSRRFRKTSISDMVQRYEAMDEQVKGKVTAPKSPGLKLDTSTTLSHGNGPFPTTRLPSSPITPRKKAHMPSARDDVTVRLSDERPTPSGLPFTTNTLASEMSSNLIPRDSLGPSFFNKPSMEERPPPPEKPVSKPITLALERVSNLAPSGSSSPSFSSKSSVEEWPPSSEKPYQGGTKFVTLILDKSGNLAPSDSSSPSLSNKSSVEERPPSPEKPYQGVSKLIDEWQRKTTAAEFSNKPPLRKGKYINK